MTSTPFFRISSVRVSSRRDVPSPRIEVEYQSCSVIRVSVEHRNAMSDKQLINAVENCLEEGLRGFSTLHPHLAVDFDTKIVFDPDTCPRRRVALISGGGSGHEPFPAGYVGSNMLTASVSGPIFTSPPSSHVLHGIRLAAAKYPEVLLLVPNYTGDVLNFGLAAETALGEGVTVESVVVGEDVAQEVCGSANKAGKRGMCGLVLVFKIAGYLAGLGGDLATVKKYSEEVVRSSGSVGLCVSPCCKPGVGRLFHLEEDEVEIGVGVHGEAGVARVKMLTAHDAIRTLLEFVVRSLKLAEGDEVVAVLNNLGSLSCIEQWLLAGELEGQLTERKIKVSRLYAGCFFTSLNMAGIQICVLKLKEETREMFLTALDHPTTASAWPRTSNRPVCLKDVSVPPLEVKKTSSRCSHFTPENASFVKRCFLNISEDLTKQESHLNYLDSACGDGDCGTTFKNLATILKTFADSFNFSDPAVLFSDLSETVEGSIGGTTGALYGLFLRGCSKAVEKFDGLKVAIVVCRCWRAGVEAIKKYSSARIGDRTMLDSLETGCQVFESELESCAPEEAFRRAVKAAKEGCRNTKHLIAMAGRASYTDRSQQKDVDAGAYAVTVWLEAIQRTL